MRTTHAITELSYLIESRKEQSEEYKKLEIHLKYLRNQLTRRMLAK